MKEKLKKINLTLVASILKASLIGVIVSILMVLAFAFALKFVDLNSATISLIDQIIKIVSVVAAVGVLSKSNSQSLLVKGIAVGAVYSLLTFVVFSVLNGGLNFGVATLTDMVFSAMVGGATAMLLNILRKK